jgi:hypothetical protein
LTATALQRHYLRAAQDALAEPWMPGWAAAVCGRWEAVLDELEAGPERLAKILDWPIKRALYGDRLRRRGSSWEAIAAWTRVLRRLLPGWERGRPALPGREALAAEGALAARARRLAPVLRKEGLDWDGLDAFLALRQELFELDARWAQLSGGGGIFADLDAQSVLQHAAPGVVEIERAMVEPPADTRARLRGECIRRYAGEREQYACDWFWVLDRRQQRLLDLSQPFEQEWRWREATADDLPLYYHPRYGRERERGWWHRLGAARR